MKNLILVLLALPGWVAAQTDSSIRYIDLVATEIPLNTKCEGNMAISSCCSNHAEEKGMQVEPHWCHDHSHCMHRHRHRITAEDQAAACAEQCQHHSNYKLSVAKETIRLLDSPQIWPDNLKYPGWKATLSMPFPFSAYGRNVHHLSYYSDNYFGLEDEDENEIVDISALDMRTTNEKMSHNNPIYKHSLITYQTDGQTGDRILKVQFLGIRRYFSDTLIIQTWLHEATSEISLHYLKMPVNKKDEHAEVSLWASCPDGRHEMYITGLSNNPQVQCASQYMCGLPDNGTVYTLKPVHLVLPERKQLTMQHQAFEVKVTPQTGLHQLVGLVGSDELQLFDAQGRLVKRIKVEQARQGFLLDDCAAGAYLLHDPLYGQSVRLIKP